MLYSLSVDDVFFISTTLDTMPELSEDEGDAFMEILLLTAEIEGVEKMYENGKVTYWEDDFVALNETLNKYSKIVLLLLTNRAIITETTGTPERGNLKWKFETVDSKNAVMKELIPVFQLSGSFC